MFKIAAENMRYELSMLGRTDSAENIAKYTEMYNSGLPVIAYEDCPDGEHETEFSDIVALFTEWPAASISYELYPDNGHWIVYIVD